MQFDYCHFGCACLRSGLSCPHPRSIPSSPKLDICVNASIAGDIFKLLTLEQGTAQHLKELCIKEDPLRTAISGILKEADGLYLMVTSRSYGDSCLETLVLSLTSAWGDWPLAFPVAQDSPFRDLFRIKEKGLHIELLFDGKDCFIDSEARVEFFGLTKFRVLNLYLTLDSSSSAPILRFPASLEICRVMYLKHVTSHEYTTLW